MATLKGIVAITVLGCLAAFMLQNREILQLRFLLWEFETRRAFMLIAVFVAGLTLGWIVATVSQLAARGRDEARRSAAETGR